MKIEIFKIKDHSISEKTYEEYHICKNSNFIHLKNGIFLFNYPYSGYNVIDEEDLENHFNVETTAVDEILEMPSDDTEREWNTLLKLCRL